MNELQAVAMLVSLCACSFLVGASYGWGEGFKDCSRLHDAVDKIKSAGPSGDGNGGE